ncbi:hypothetical protein HID58_048231 [Brassica napus]|uniref:Uncharacterized protein n=1 Tax=Brassica napus TaxID=3708 RepID=A0ABQ8B1U8_BRANA|nr:hypothetical protein HID58_048231 [Brassica napus]
MSYLVLETNVEEAYCYLCDFEVYDIWLGERSDLSTVELKPSRIIEFTDSNQISSRFVIHTRL